MKKSLFWADQIADEIIRRKKFRYVNKKISKSKEYTVKTSASISGVLHIGRLSDTIRGASVHRALEEKGIKSRLIWIAEDMDPLRKIPEGVPKKFSKFIGSPVNNIPDPFGCHKTYADHHTSKYFEVLDEFVDVKMKKFSMGEEYKKGNFSPFIKKLLNNVREVIDIQNKYRDTKLSEHWAPWTPICKNCGKIITPHTIDFDGKKVKYVCKDYEFEKTTAKGCNYEGEADPLKDEGKLMWKSEWAAQWALWKVSSEGAGKEYQVPGSAFWINGEIVERILDYPMPVPIFYEHLMIDGVKMSASLGNVIYPKDWLEVATPQLLRYFYNKKLMKTRSFSWEHLPDLFDEYDLHAKVYSGEIKIGNKTDEAHMKRLYAISQLKKIRKPLDMKYTHASYVSQIFEKEKDMLNSLKKTGQYQKKNEKEILERLKLAKIWVEKYAPEQYKFTLNEKVPVNTKKKLSLNQKKALKLLAKRLEGKKYSESKLYEEFKNIMKEVNIKPQEFFQGAYLALLNKKQGPKLAGFILTIGQKKVSKLIGSV